MANQPFKVVENSQKQMPCNIEAEQAVIASILVSNDIYDEISPILDSQNRAIAAISLSGTKSTINIRTIPNLANKVALTSKLISSEITEN